MKEPGQSEVMQPLRPPALPSLTQGDALFLDFDGTLVAIAETPDQVRVPSALPTLLANLTQDLDGAVAIVSGRPRRDLVSMLSPYAGEMVGVYGLDRRLKGGAVQRRSRAVQRARTVLDAFVGHTKGLVLEDKRVALTLHFRARPDLVLPCVRAANQAAAAADHRLLVNHGKMALELIPPGAGKDRAIEELMKLPPFAGRRPVFVGDDQGDEPGFAYVNGVGGVSIHVGFSQGTGAQFRLANPEAVIAWLSRPREAA